MNYPSLSPVTLQVTIESRQRTLKHYAIFFQQHENVPNPQHLRPICQPICINPKTDNPYTLFHYFLPHSPLVIRRIYDRSFNSLLSSFQQITTLELIDVDSEALCQEHYDFALRVPGFKGLKMLSSLIQIVFVLKNAGRRWQIRHMKSIIVGGTWRCWHKRL
jgi:hypothetical protein